MPYPQGSSVHEVKQEVHDINDHDFQKAVVVVPPKRGAARSNIFFNSRKGQYPYNKFMVQLNQGGTIASKVITNEWGKMAVAISITGAQDVAGLEKLDKFIVNTLISHKGSIPTLMHTSDDAIRDMYRPIVQGGVGEMWVNIHCYEGDDEPTHEEVKYRHKVCKIIDYDNKIVSIHDIDNRKWDKLIVGIGGINVSSLQSINVTGKDLRLIRVSGKYTTVVKDIEFI